MTPHRPAKLGVRRTGRARISRCMRKQISGCLVAVFLFATGGMLAAPQVEKSPFVAPTTSVQFCGTGPVLLLPLTT